MTVRRGMCPGLADPMLTGDGLLARFAVARAIPLDTLAALCTAARAHGNGVIEITSRGSLQIRGLTPRSAPAFAAAVAELGIADAAAERVLANPLAGLDPHEIFDATGIAARLRERLVESDLAAGLGPKVCVVVDGGGALHLDAIPCDIRLRAEVINGATSFRVSVASDSTNEMTAPEGAVETVLDVLRAIAALGPTARARDLLPLAASPGAAKTPARLTAHPIGMHCLRDGTLAVGIGLAFGHSDADTLPALIDEARTAGAVSARPAPGRVLLLIGIAPAQATGFAAKAEQLGFISNPDDPRRRVVACAGAPACTAAEIPTRVLAPAIAAAARRGGRTIHVSGCSKGCAHPTAADLTIVGVNSRCGIVPNGRAQDTPVEFVSVNDLPNYLARCEAEREVAHG
jgi:precorrin-3B synthase